jgi:hypothetical protein
VKNKNILCPYKELSIFYNSCLKTFGSHIVYVHGSFSVTRCFLYCGTSRPRKSRNKNRVRSGKV